MRWCFTDYTHKKNLVAEILSLCEIDVAGPVYHIKLEDHSQAEPFDVGQILITSAQVKEVIMSLLEGVLISEGVTHTVYVQVGI